MEKLVKDFILKTTPWIDEVEVEKLPPLSRNEIASLFVKIDDFLYSVAVADRCYEKESNLLYITEYTGEEYGSGCSCLIFSINAEYKFDREEEKAFIKIKNTSYYSD